MATLRQSYSCGLKVARVNLQTITASYSPLEFTLSALLCPIALETWIQQNDHLLFTKTYLGCCLSAEGRAILGHHCFVVKHINITRFGNAIHRLHLCKKRQYLSSTALL